MHPVIIILFAAFTSCTPTLTENLSPRGNVPSPGPIPYQNPEHGLPNQQSVVGNNKHSKLTQSKNLMKACLVAYGSDRFYDSWDGNDCGGFGWFKGSNNGKIGTYECYQTCASWLEGDGIDNGSTDYQCDFRTGMEGHCWMGYHIAAGPSLTSSAKSNGAALAPLASGTASVNTS